MGHFLWPPDVTLRKERGWLVFSALLLTAAWPPLPFGFLAFIALVKPLDILSKRSFGGAFKGGYLFAFVYHLSSLYWIVWVTIPGTFAACAIIALYTAFVFGLFGSLYRISKPVAVALFPFLWIGMEYFRTLLEIAFPWSNLSYTQHSYLPFLQIMEYTGDAGISFLIVVVNIILWRLLRETDRSRKAVLAVIGGLIIIVPTVYGVIVMKGSNPEKKPERDDGISIAMLQGHVEPEVKWAPGNKKWNIRLYDSLAGKAGDVDLIVWPETAVPAYLLSEYNLTRMVAQAARKTGIPMLVGMLDYKIINDSVTEYYNAAVQFDADGSYRRPYHKMKLVPYAETVPYGELTPWLEETPMGWSDFSHGERPIVYKNIFGDYGTLICYEVLFPELVNEYVERGADFLVNITNDTWWGHSAAPYQHGIMAIFRAIENRIYIARCANSGFSYFVDGYGRIYNRSDFLERTIIRGVIYPIEEKTFFNRTGPIPGQLGLLLIGAVSILLAVRKFIGGRN